MSVSFDPNSCIESVRLFWTLGHYFKTSVAFGESLRKLNLKTNGGIKKRLKIIFFSLMAASYLKLFQTGTKMKIG
jgi:hypothetical protein